MFDAPDDPDTESAYECMDCGEVLAGEDNPMVCPNCGSSVQNRANSLE